MMRQRDVSEKISALSQFPQNYFPWVEVECETFTKKTSNHWKQRDELHWIVMHEDEIIRVSDVEWDSKLLFYEMIQFVQIHVRKQLRRQIPDGDALRSLSLEFHPQTNNCQ